MAEIVRWTDVAIRIVLYIKLWFFPANILPQNTTKRIQEIGEKFVKLKNKDPAKISCLVYDAARNK